MPAALLLKEDNTNPLDLVETLAASRDWFVDRASDDEVNMIVAGTWCDLHLSLNWRPDLEGLHLACTFDQKVPDGRIQEVSSALSIINEQLFFGHFDLWRPQGTLLFRHSILLTGGASVSPQQCEGLISLGLSSAERYYPVFQFIIWGGKSAHDAIQASMLETVGEA